MTSVLELDRTKWITNDLQIWHRYRRELADNGESADAWVGLFVAPGTSGAEWVYLETNGDPVLVGAIDEDGEFELSEDYPDDALEPWLVETLRLEFDVADSVTAARLGTS